jgi:Zn-dependent alcohol dehydrogenase
VDRVESKNEICLNQGANFFFTDIAEIPNKIDLIVDTTGNIDVISEAFKMLSNRGRMILLGQPKPGQVLVIPEAIEFFKGSGLAIKASQGGSTVPQEDIPRYLELLRLNRLNIDNLVTDRYQLNEINEAFETLKSGNAGRIVINLETESNA